MKEIYDKIIQSIADYLPNLLAALAILVIGWIVAVFIAAIIRTVLRRTTVDNKVAQAIFGSEAKKEVPVENVVSKGVFYLLMVFVLVAFFQALKLTMLTEPLNGMLNKMFSYLPNLLGAAALLLLAWVIATVLKRVMLMVFKGAKLDQRLGGAAAEAQAVPISKTLSDVVYWLVFLLFLPGILDALGLQGPLEPVKTLLNRISEFMPNILGAVAILFIGWFVARLVRQIVTNLLAASGLDRIGERVGLATTLGSMKLSGLVGLLLYILILIPVLIAGLNALQLDAITQPASEMLGKIMDAIPSVFGAVLVLAISYVVARLVTALLTNFLAGAGFDNILLHLGMTKTTLEGNRAPSAIVGLLALAAIMLAASVEAARLLEFEAVAEILAKLLVFGGHIVLGVVIFGVGIFLANLVARSVQQSSSPHAELMATITRVAILVLAGAMALRQMEIANEIVNLAFGLLLGAVAVAVALAFGLGGRESASRLIEEWRKSTGGKGSS
jgi:hypothetical protein